MAIFLFLVNVMFNPDELSDDAFDAVSAYAIDLYYAAAESLYENNSRQYERLVKLSGNEALEIECALDTAEMFLDPEEVGEGDIIRASLYFVPEGKSADDVLSVHFADVYFTAEGMEEKLGTVVWFPDEDQWH